MTSQFNKVATILQIALALIGVVLAQSVLAGEPKELVIHEVQVDYDFEAGAGTAKIVGLNFPEYEKLRVSLAGSEVGITIDPMTATETSIDVTLPENLTSGEYLLTVYKDKKGPVCDDAPSKYCDEFDLSISDAQHRLLLLEQITSCTDCCQTTADCSDGTMCTEDSCVAGTCQNEPLSCEPADQCSVSSCDEMMGGCVSTPKDCSPYTCNLASGCRTSCTANQHCEMGFYCSQGSACVPAKPNGASCVSDSECLNGHCPADDGICCDQACDSLCEACVESKTGAPSGSCAYVTAQTDPDNECNSAFQPFCSGSGNTCY